MKNTYDLDCNLAQTLNLLGDRWTILVLHRIYQNINTFKKLEKSLDSIPTNILSNRLKLLTESGLISKELYSEHPPRYKYIITKKGKDFNHVFNSMIIWASKYLKDCTRTIAHKKCNHEVDIVYYCKECKEIFHDRDLIIKNYKNTEV